ncbi:MAG: SIMPL domain-containing protein [Hyphomicrobium sp.]|nr:SIMPL domain-containing protein [Hyphomicrobium sp.]
MRSALTSSVQVLSLATVLCAAQSFALKAEETPMQRMITVSATATISAKPDQARISSGVVSEAPSAREALSKNTELMKKVIAGLKTGGIDADDIQTSSFSVEPITVYGKDGVAPRISGYRVANQVGVLVRDLAKLGDVLDQLVTVGANQVGGLSFDVSKAETLKDEARKEAMVVALRRATLLAEAGGAALGPVLQIAEDVVIDGPRPFATARIAKAEAVPIESGTSTLEARVTVIYALK